MSAENETLRAGTVRTPYSPKGVGFVCNYEKCLFNSLFYHSSGTIRNTSHEIQGLPQDASNTIIMACFTNALKLNPNITIVQKIHADDIGAIVGFTCDACTRI
jgi:hypothetical protein